VSDDKSAIQSMVLLVSDRPPESIFKYKFLNKSKLIKTWHDIC